MKFIDFFEEVVVREVREVMQSKRLPRRLPKAKPVYRSPDDELDSDGDDDKPTLKKLSYSDKINLDKIPDDIGDQIMPGEKEDRTSPNFELDPFPDTAAKEPSNKVLSGIKKVLTVLLYPVYGPVVSIVSKFFPTAFLAEMLKTLRFHGDTIIGDARRRRNVQRTIRKAIVAREKEMSEEMRDAIMSGKFDDDLDSLLASGLEDILPDTFRSLSGGSGSDANKQSWIKLKRGKVGGKIPSQPVDHRQVKVIDFNSSLGFDLKTVSLKDLGKGQYDSMLKSGLVAIDSHGVPTDSYEWVEYKRNESKGRMLGTNGTFGELKKFLSQTPENRERSRDERKEEDLLKRKRKSSSLFDDNLSL